MEVTIAIINYNYGRFLRQAIESALNQISHVDYEVLIIDDGSTDCSDEVLESYSGNDKVRVSKTPNQGFAKSLCRSVSEARGTYLFLMDADDYFKDNKLENTIHFLRQGYLYVTDTSTYVDEDGKIIGKGAYGSTSCDAINVEAAKLLLPVENELSFYSFYKLGRGKILADSYTYYRVHGNSMTNRNEPGKQQDYLAKITFNLSETLDKLANEDLLKKWQIKRTNVMRVANFFRAQANYNLLEGSLERKKRKLAFVNFFKMIFYALLSNSISIFHIKMFVKTILCRASFPKK